MSLWRGKYPLILASQSRARQALLANAGIEFEAVAAEIDERAVQQASSLSAPGDIAALLAREKALSVSTRRPGNFVIGADQTLEDFVLIYLAWRSFEPLGNPAATLRLRQMHEIGADGIAVDTTGLLGGFAGQCFQVRMLQRLEQAERVERCFQIAPAAEGVEHAFALFVAGCFRGADSVCEGAPSGLLGRLRRFCGTLF